MTAEGEGKIAVHPTTLTVRKEVTVEVSPERAFEVFTDEIDSWWIREHHNGPGELKQVIVEPRQEGRCYNLEVDGNEVDWGKVLAWDPPGRVVIGWQLNAEWRYDPDFVTEVEVTFTETAADTTLVVLEHRNLDRYGDAQAPIHEALDSEGGWGGSIASYAAAVRAQAEEG
jgi:uncharacterized protein YndB with AHSA1/START domain